MNYHNSKFVKFLKKTPLWSSLVKLYFWRFRLIQFPILYDNDDVITSHYPWFQREEKFLSAVKADRGFGRDEGFPDWRLHVLCGFAFNALRNNQGNLVEFGVDEGSCAKTVLEYCDLDKEGRRYFLVDSFDGFDINNLTDDERLSSSLSARHQKFKGTLSVVQEKFKNNSCVELVRGFVPEVLNQIAGEIFCFAHVDMNAVHAEEEAFKFIFPRLISGGVIVFDDYGHGGHERQKMALDKIAHGFDRRIVCLPTGQGLLVK